MKKIVFSIAALGLSIGPLAAEPQWLASAGGTAASVVAPSSWGSGNSLSGAGLGVEYQPNFRLSLGLGYQYLGFNGPSVNAGANVLGLGGKLFVYELSSSRVYLGGGAGYDISSANAVGNWSFHLDAGLRWRLHERVAVDTAVNYAGFTPIKSMIQAVGLTVAVVVPLDAPFSSGSAKKMAAAPGQAPASPVKLEVPAGVKTDIQQGKSLSPTAKPMAKPSSKKK